MKIVKDSELCLDQSFVKHLSSIHAGTDILFTKRCIMVSDSVKTIMKLWYRNEALEVNTLKKKSAGFARE